MLKNIPPILSPELLKVLCEMGHGDEMCIRDRVHGQLFGIPDLGPRPHVQLGHQ